MTKYTSEEIKNRLSNIGEAIGPIALEYIVELEKENQQLKQENEQLKAQIEKMKCCWNCKHPAKGSTGCCCPFAASCHNRSLWEMGTD